MYFSYYKAKCVHNALELLRQEELRIIAGGTDILVGIQEGLESPQALLDIGDLEQLQTITENDGMIEVGALCTHARIVQSALLQEKAPVLVQGSADVGSPQIRARGTIGGNIVTASPAGDTIPPLFCLDAVVNLKNARTERSVPIKDFFTGVKKTVIRPDELLMSVTFPPIKNTARCFFIKLGQRKALAISKGTVVACIDLKDESISNIRIAMGSVAPTVIRATRTEEYLRGKLLSQETINKAARMIKKESQAIDDIRSEAEYRNEMAGVLLERGLTTVLQKLQVVD